MNESANNSSSKMILLVLYFGWIISYIDRTVISLAIVQIGEDLTLDASKLGIVLSAFFMGYAIMQIPGGWLADRFGSRKVIVAAVIAWSVFTALSGLAWSLTSLLLIRFLFGIGEGGYPAASTKAISDYFPKDKRTKAQSTMMSSNALGAAVAPLICAPLLVAFGWRNVFLFVGLLGIVFVVWFLLVTRKAGGYANSKAAVKPSGKEYAQLLRDSYLWKVLLIFFFVNITNWGLLSWMPSYLMQGLGIDLKSVGLFSAIPTLFLTVGMIVSGRIINKVGSNAKYGVIIGILITGASLYPHVFCIRCFPGHYVSVHCFFVYVLCHELCFYSATPGDGTEGSGYRIWDHQFWWTGCRYFFSDDYGCSYRFDRDLPSCVHILNDMLPNRYSNCLFLTSS